MTARLVWWRSLRRTTSYRPPSTSSSSQGWRSKWPTRCFGRRRLVQSTWLGSHWSRFDFSGGMFRGSCFNCGADKQGRRGHAITRCHVHFHGSSLIDACKHVQYMHFIWLRTPVYQSANLKLACGQIWLYILCNFSSDRTLSLISVITWPPPPGQLFP